MKNKFRFDSFLFKDCADRVAAINSYDVLSGIFIDVPATLEKTEQWCQTLNQQSNRKDFVLRDEAGKAVAFAGLVGIDQKHGVCELYIFLGDKHRGQGLGTHFLKCLAAYAKLELKLRKITLYVSSGNKKTNHFYERFGFVQEGLLKEHAWHRGQYVDRYIYSLFLEGYAPSLNIYTEF